MREECKSCHPEWHREALHGWMVGKEEEEGGDRVRKREGERAIDL